MAAFVDKRHEQAQRVQREGGDGDEPEGDRQRAGQEQAC